MATLDALLLDQIRRIGEYSAYLEWTAAGRAIFQGILDGLMSDKIPRRSRRVARRRLSKRRGRTRA